MTSSSSEFKGEASSEEAEKATKPRVPGRLRKFFVSLFHSENPVPKNTSANHSVPSPKMPPKANGDAVANNLLPPMEKPLVKSQIETKTENKPPLAKEKQRVPSKNKERKIQSLNHLDDETLYEKLTGEKPSAPSDLAPLKAVENKESEPTETTKADRMKTYPTNPQEELDLHGKKALEAEREIRLFILRAKRQSMRLVRIITGKGLHSEEGQSVLRDVAEKKAIELKREGVVFSHKWEKGSGSLLVYLK